MGQAGSTPGRAPAAWLAGSARATGRFNPLPCPQRRP